MSECQDHGWRDKQICPFCMNIVLHEELAAISDALGTNEGHSSVDNIRLLKAEMEQLKKELGIAYCYRSLYLELLYSVSDKTPYESRHATALRYIKEREMYAKRITHCENCGDTYFDSGMTVGCPVCKYPGDD